MSDNAAINLVEQFDFDKKQLGVVLALVEKGPAVIPSFISQLAIAGSLGQAVKTYYDQAKLELDAVDIARSPQ